MIAASYSLIVEGCLFEDSKFGLLSLMPLIDPSTHSIIRTACGFLLGILFILITKTVLSKFDDMQIMDGERAALSSSLPVFTLYLLQAVFLPSGWF